eukprot:16010785-Heterocapsa_arctica.AAC.1
MTANRVPQQTGTRTVRRERRLPKDRNKNKVCIPHKAGSAGEQDEKVVQVGSSRHWAVSTDGHRQEQPCPRSINCKGAV